MRARELSGEGFLMERMKGEIKGVGLRQVSQRGPRGMVGRWAKNKVHTWAVWKGWAHCTHRGQGRSGISPWGPVGRM